MDRIKRFFHIAPKKHHVEFITALLSIPVLLTVIALNWSSLSGNKKEEVQKPSQIIISLPVQKNPTSIPPKPQCKTGLGETSITRPEEGDTITENPVNVTIVYKPGEYCSAVWSYRINSGNWSDFDDKSIALYNPPSGNIQLELRVKSIVSGEQKMLTRNFFYKGSNPTATITPTTTPSPTQALTPAATQ